jgi:hypothetical protein
VLTLACWWRWADSGIFLREPLLNSSQAMVTEMVRNSAQDVPLNAGTTIGKAVQSLTTLAEFEVCHNRVSTPRFHFSFSIPYPFWFSFWLWFLV